MVVQLESDMPGLPTRIAKRLHLLLQRLRGLLEGGWIVGRVDH
jgi:hypothetical protein